MANYTAADVKALREKSGAGMMDCKGALDEADGDIEKAFEVLRLKGLKGVSKREGRTTSNGLVVSRIAGETAVMIELGMRDRLCCKAENFVTLADQVADCDLCFWRNLNRDCSRGTAWRQHSLRVYHRQGGNHG